MANQEEQMFCKLAETKKTGYLNENFRLFHLCDKKEQTFDFHYHDFHKIVIFLSGEVTYFIEGKSYPLKPWDILLVGRGDIHKAVISPDCEYERVVIWIKNDFVANLMSDNADLLTCFSKAAEENFHLIRMPQDSHQFIRELLTHLDAALKSDEFASSMLATAYFLQLLVFINRFFLAQDLSCKDSFVLTYDKQIEEIIRYINRNLTANLSNDALADAFFLNRYYLMHRFKEETGYTLHQYVEQKRVSCAAAAIRSGTPVIKACFLSGFPTYATFLRAFHRKYKINPTEYEVYDSSDIEL